MRRYLFAYQKKSKRWFWFPALLLILSLPENLFAQVEGFRVLQQQDQRNDIHCYLGNVASQITWNSLSKINSLDDWTNVRENRKEMLLEMLGLEDKFNAPRPPLNIKKTGVIDQEGFKIEKLYYESMPGLFVAANLYIPENKGNKMPGILYVCGHAHTQKHHYQAHARNFALNGFVVLIIETIQRGEVKGEHLGAYEKGFFHWYSRGYNPGGVEVWNGIRGLDLLSELPEVDKRKLGVTGISGGGSQSWYLPAVDNRIKAAAAVAGAGSLEGQIRQRTIDDHCDCMMPINTYKIDFTDIGALIAPRPFMIAQTRQDIYYSIESVRTLYHKIKSVYQLYNQPDNLQMKEAEGKHSYGSDESLRAEILAFFLKELKGENVSLNDVGTISVEKVLSNESLKVYGREIPKGDLTKVIQESFVPMAVPPKIPNELSLKKYKEKVVSLLRQKTFNGFPEIEVPLAIREEFKGAPGNTMKRNDYSFVSEEGWRLPFSVRKNKKSPKTKKKPVLLVLRNPEEERYASESFISGAYKQMDVIFLETRGTGRTAWSPSRQWHIRRSAAWTGRTVASMRVYDVLRSLQAIRQLPEYGPDVDIHLAAQGEMTVVAAYSALMDGNVETLFLKDLPATQNMASDPAGKENAIELLNCLKITDIPQVVGLHCPKKVVLIGDVPTTYDWAEDLYSDLDNSSGLEHTEELKDWFNTTENFKK